MIAKAEILEQQANVDEGDSDLPTLPPKQKKVHQAAVTITITITISLTNTRVIKKIFLLIYFKRFTIKK